MNIKHLTNGLIKENPIFVQLLGMCPTLAVTGTAINGMGMGLATTVVLVLANIVIAMIRNLVPSKIRIPIFIVVIASFVTVVGMMMEAFVPALFEALGLFIPLIVVNCLILARAEAFAFKNGVFSSTLDGIGMGLGFTLSLTILGMVREFFGSGSIFGFDIMNRLFENVQLIQTIFGQEYRPMGIIGLAPGAFLTLGLLLALYNVVQAKRA